MTSQGSRLEFVSWSGQDLHPHLINCTNWCRRTLHHESWGGDPFLPGSKRAEEMNEPLPFQTILQKAKTKQKERSWNVAKGCQWFKLPKLLAREKTRCFGSKQRSFKGFMILHNVDSQWRCIYFWTKDFLPALHSPDIPKRQLGNSTVGTRGFPSLMKQPAMES